MKRYTPHSLLIFLVALLMTACYPTRYVAEGEHLYIGSSYELKQGEFKDNSISSYFKHKTNKKAFGVRNQLIWYNINKRFNDSTSNGEEPILYDSTKISETITNIETYLHNEGYFDAYVEVRIKEGKLIRKRKTKKAIFDVYLGDPYHIKDIKLDINDPAVRAFVMVDLTKSKIKKGNRFSVSNLKSERKRITQSMQNKGYFYFKEDLISFDVDTNFAGPMLDLTFKVAQYKIRDEEADTIITIPNRRFKVRHVYIYSDISATDIGPQTDTLVYKTVESRDTSVYHFLYNDPLVISPKAITRAIYIEQGIYKKSDATETYKHLGNLSNFNTINVGFQDVSKSLEGYGELDCIIELHRYPRYFNNIEFGAKNTGGQFGLELTEAVGHKNLFGNAEVASLQAHGALEVQSSVQDSVRSLLFNTWEIGLNTKIDVPRFLFPFGRKIFPRYFNPTTSFTFGYNLQSRTDFKRNILNGSYIYAWKPSKYNRIRIPVNLSAVSINTSDAFQKTIDGFEDPRIRYAYQNHLVSGFGINFTHNKQQVRSLKPYSYFSLNFEAGGFLFHSLRGLMEQDDLGQYKIGRLPYSNYSRLQLDYRAYLPTGKSIVNVFRLYFGGGVAFLNSQALPFEKSFYAGGANNLRGWVLGTAGPGSFSDNTAYFEKTGDMKIELNYEVRFPLGGAIEMGLFVDAGNIWLLKENEDFVGGNLTGNFYKEFNISAGYGIRYDLDFLILRLDMAHPIYQPYLPEGSRWDIKNQSYAKGVISEQLQNSKFRLLNELSPYVPVVNFAIGYPF